MNLFQHQIQKYYHYQNDEDEDDDDDDQENHQPLIGDLEKIHDEHLTSIKKKKKETKSMAPINERFRK